MKDGFKVYAGRGITGRYLRKTGQFPKLLPNGDFGNEPGAQPRNQAKDNRHSERRGDRPPFVF
jgi:hypothetical protein